MKLPKAEGALVSLKLCSFLLLSYLLFALPSQGLAGRSDERVDKELIAKKTATVIDGKSTWSEKVLALHSFVSKRIKEVPTSYN